jgi:four helix bundle protein
VFRFERLDVWRKSVDFAILVYETTNGFPADERFGLATQLRRSAVSISANIAEGSSRASDRDFSRFVEVAFGSLCETVSHLHIARSQMLMEQERHEALYSAAEELSKMLSAFRNTLGNWKTVAGTS